jgi:hypothetical protein
VLDISIAVLRDAETQSRGFVEAALSVWAIVTVVTQREVSPEELAFVMDLFPVRTRGILIKLIARFMSFAHQKWPDAVQEDIIPFAALVFGGESLAHRMISPADLTVFARVLGDCSEEELHESIAGQESALFDIRRRVQSLATGIISQT